MLGTIFTNQFMQKSYSLIIKVNYYAMVISSSKECIKILKGLSEVYTIFITFLTYNFEKVSIFLKYRE